MILEVGGLRGAKWGYRGMPLRQKENLGRGHLGKRPERVITKNAKNGPGCK